MKQSPIPKKKIDSVLKQTSKKLVYPPEVIGDVVKHAFTFISDYIENPTNPGLRFINFGVFRPKLRAINSLLSKSIIPALRKNRTSEELIKEFRTY